MLYIKLEDILKQLKEFFEEVSGIREVYLFGSVVRGDHLPWSDIDLLILSEDPQRVRIIVSSFLDEIFVNEGILISAIFEDLNGMSIISKQFKREGKLLWAKRKNF